MYIIEVKQGNPNLTEVQAKIQYCINTMLNILPNSDRDFRIVPLLCASSFHGIINRAFLSYRVTISGKRVLIQRRKHEESINTL
jgi:hypothetical protein